jgi:NAD(P)-dependent dehydrogenase (short-subunit alcohol dehydrogenase family)
MGDRLGGKVALITGAARGIGRAQAVRFAQEGADVIALDICGPVDTVVVPPATPEDLDETVRLVTEAGARIVSEIVDVRDLSRLQAATDRGVERLGGLDVVCATAGITSRDMATDMDENTWQTMLDVNLSGVWRTCRATAPHLVELGRIDDPDQLNRRSARSGRRRALHRRQTRCRRVNA